MKTLPDDEYTAAPPPTIEISTEEALAKIISQKTYTDDDIREIARLQREKRREQAAREVKRRENAQAKLLLAEKKKLKAAEKEAEAAAKKAVKETPSASS